MQKEKQQGVEHLQTGILKSIVDLPSEKKKLEQDAPSIRLV